MQFAWFLCGPLQCKILAMPLKAAHESTHEAVHEATYQTSHQASHQATHEAIHQASGRFMYSGSSTAMYTQYRNNFK